MLIEVPILILFQEPKVLELNEPKIHLFPRMYALSKTGSIRVYDITVEDMGDHAVMTTRKKVTLNGKWTEDKYEYWEGVNIGKSNETTYLEQALSEAQSAWKRLQDAGFTVTMPDKDAKFNTDANGKIKPMLAKPFDERKVKFPCIAQYKYDGVRSIVFLDNGNVTILSRKGKVYDIPHLQGFFEEHKELLPLDGELYNHKELTFQEIVSAVKRHSEITPKIRMVCYDIPMEGQNNKQRINLLHNKLSNIDKDSPIYEAPHVVLNSMDDLYRFHKKAVGLGYEGIIIRNFSGKYEFGFRSNDLIKYKEFDDAEFEIVDVIEATGRDAGTSVMVLRTSDGNEFNAKPQGSRELRAEYLKNRRKIIGKWATVQYQGLSDDGVPRFPSLITIRDYE